MFQHLISKELITAKELEHVTGRGASTVYRWISGETDPGLDDTEKLLTHLRSPEAKRKILSHFIGSIPVSVEWVDDSEDQSQTLAAQDALGRSMLAMRCLSDVLWTERQAFQAGRMTEDQYAQLVDQIEAVIHHLTHSRNLMSHQVSRRKKAK